MGIKKTKPVENEVKNEEEVVTTTEVVTPRIYEGDEEVANPSTLLLNGANELVSEVFGLHRGYTLLQFADKGSRAVLTLGSPDFEITVTIKGNEYYNLKARLGLEE